MIGKLLSLLFILQASSLHCSPLLSEADDTSNRVSIVTISNRTSDMDVRLARSLFSSRASSVRSEGDFMDLSLHSIPVPPDRSLEEEHPALQPTTWTRRKKLKIAGMSAIGLLAGASMTPVYLDDLASFFPSLAEDSLLSDGVRYGVMSVLIADNISRNLAIALDEGEFVSPRCALAGKAILTSSALLPVIFFYNIEYAHARNDGFETWNNPYMTVFYLGMAPLFINQYLQSSYYASDLAEDSSLTKSQKTFVYGLTGISLLAQGYVGTIITRNALLSFGIDEDVSMTLGIISGGVLMNTMNALHQMHGFRKLAQMRNTAASYGKAGALSVLASLKAIPQTITAWQGMPNMPQIANGLLAANVFLSESTEQTGTHWLSLAKIRQFW